MLTKTSYFLSHIMNEIKNDDKDGIITVDLSSLMSNNPFDPDSYDDTPLDEVRASLEEIDLQEQVKEHLQNKMGYMLDLLLQKDLILCLMYIVSHIPDRKLPNIVFEAMVMWEDN
ncbi:unnamed protein product, partial [marine sediment metagenome]